MQMQFTKPSLHYSVSCYGPHYLCTIGVETWNTYSKNWSLWIIRSYETYVWYLVGLFLHTMSFINWLNHIIWCHFNREMDLSGIIKTSSGQATCSVGARNRERKGRRRPCRSRGARTRPCHRSSRLRTWVFYKKPDTTLKKPTCSELAIQRADIDFLKFLVIFTHWSTDIGVWIAGSCDLAGILMILPTL
jgi:hypothetical protein